MAIPMAGVRCRLATPWLSMLREAPVTKLRLALPLAILTVWLVAVQTAPPPNDAHFHHVHMNVVDPQRSIDFYRRYFSAVPVKFAGRSDALFTGRTFFLLNKVAKPDSEMNKGIWHLGWSGIDVDPATDYAFLKSRGVQFQIPLTTLAPFLNHFMYVYGPDKEIIEVAGSRGGHAYNHVHLITKDPDATIKWYADMLGTPMPPRDVLPTRGIFGKPPFTGSAKLMDEYMGESFTVVRLDGVGIIGFRLYDTEPAPGVFGSNPPGVYGNKPLKTIESTKGSVIDHMAFSYRNIEPVFERMKKAGAQIVEPITLRLEYGFKSFFVLGPEKVLIEIVEAKPVPDVSWERN